MNLLGVFGGGLWIIPLVVLIGSLYSFYRSYKQWKSGSAGWIWENNTPKWVESDKKVPFLSIGSFWFGVILMIAFWVIVAAMIADK